MKSGIKTTELWLTIIANILIDSGSFGVPDKWKAITTALTVGGYSLARGLAKLNAPTVPATVPVAPPVTPVTKVTG